MKKTAPQKTVKTITVNTDEQNPMDVNVIAEHIAQVSDAFEKIGQSKLNERAIVLLLYDLCGGSIGKGDIKVILHNAKLLKKYFTK